MAFYFLDSSASVKKYVSETGSAWILRLFKPASQNAVYVAQITGVEVVSAISRRFRGNSLTLKATQKALSRFKRDFQNKLRVLRLTDQIIFEAMRLSETHGLRGYDAVQLAVVLELEKRLNSLNLSSVIFVSADNNLNNAAQSEGLAIENPNNYP